jgi:hypothetical protein
MGKYRQKFLKKTIEENGLDDASKMLGIPKLKLIRLSECYIDLSMANDIIRELFNEGIMPFSYKNCKLSLDGFSGTLDWWCDWSDEYYKNYEDEVTYSYATPFWDVTDGIPVDTISYDILDSSGRKKIFTEGDFKNDETYTYIKWEDSFENLDQYRLWIKHFYLPQVYNVILKHLKLYRNLTY